MANNTVFIVILSLLLINGLILSNVVNGLPLPEENSPDSSSDLVDLETSANTIIFRPMFLYRLQQKRIQQKLIQLHKQRAQQGQQTNSNQLR